MRDHRGAGQEDWYRNEKWNSEIERGFFERLARSRGQRDQQLKIQIQVLAGRFPRDALSLIELYHDTRTDKVWDLDVIAASAKAYENLGEPDKALDAYRSILQHDENQPFFPTWVLLEAPFLIARKGNASDFQFAFELLRRAELNISKQGVNFAIQRFILYASHALIRHRSGQKKEAKENAIAALQEAAVQYSGLRYHRKVGLVGTEHQATILALKSITSGYPVWLLGLMAKAG
jgi:tetratricopeptide (TPR) repeat protein